jgi:dolichol-phosphate mannosyltransferase
MLALAVTAVLAFSARPLQLVIRTGFVIMVTGVLYLLYVVGMVLLEPQFVVRGWASILSAELVLGGLQLTAIGLIGEYLVQLLAEAKGRPLYVFKQRPPDVEANP